jgi:hypothetical protein
MPTACKGEIQTYPTDADAPLEMSFAYSAQLLKKRGKC